MRFLLWGTGSSAKRFMNTWGNVLLQKDKIECFVDNNVEDKSEYFGFLVINPNKIKEICFDKIVILSAAVDSISYQIVNELHIEKQKISSMIDLMNYLFNHNNLYELQDRKIGIYGDFKESLACESVPVSLMDQVYKIESNIAGELDCVIALNHQLDKENAFEQWELRKKKIAEELNISEKIIFPEDVFELYSFMMRLQFHGQFINRSKNSNKMLVVLAGYKEFLYEVVFDRLKQFCDADIDVCIATSGKYSKEIDEICEKNKWSYLSTKENNVSLVQNIAISKHPHAEYIFKLDEDIFLTKNYFNNMIQALEHAEKGNYNPGVIAPLIPINGYGYSRILEKMNMFDEFEKRFGPINCLLGRSNLVISDPNVAKFFWTKDLGFDIDDMNEKFSHEPKVELACGVRFNIGAILFRRCIWEKMKGFTVVHGSNALGQDETQLCSYCVSASCPVMVSENIVVGHLGFGPQNSEMKVFFEKNKQLFKI